MQAPQADRPAAVPWPPILIAAVLAGGVLLGRLYPLAWPGMDDLPARIIGYGIGSAGLALVAWGFLTLLRAGTTFCPTSARTGSSPRAHSASGAIRSTWAKCWSFLDLPN